MRITIGIEALVDFAFKKVFGSPGNEIVLIELLNALLVLKSPIAKVQIRNPYNDKDFEDDKLSILDLRAEDEQGRIYTIEVQLSAKPGLTRRIAFYGCEVYAGQMLEGDDYSNLKQVYTICLYRGKLWRKDKRYHHRFQLADLESRRVLKDTIAIHLVELGKYNLTVEDLTTASPSERWLYWLLHSHEHTAEELLGLFPEVGIQRATETLNNINLITKDKQMYDLRKKAQIDYNWGLKAARQEGIEIGEASGEARGEAKSLCKTIHFCQSILLIHETPMIELERLSVAELDQLVLELQAQVRSRAT